jgi:hypothetical protein
MPEFGGLTLFGAARVVGTRTAEDDVEVVEAEIAR